MSIGGCACTLIDGSWRSLEQTWRTPHRASQDTRSAAQVTLGRAPILVQHLPRDRERMRLRSVQMAGRLGLTLTEYRALEAGEPQLDYDLYLAIVDLCGWPR